MVNPRHIVWGTRRRKAEENINCGSGGGVVVEVVLMMVVVVVLTLREKSPLPEAQRRFEPATLHHAGK